MKIPREMQVHFFHRHHLSKAATRRPALHAEVRAKAGLADTDHGFLADTVQAVAEAHGRCGLALARRCRVDRGDEDQLAIRA